MDSIAFGFCAIWSMHFVGMLACGLDVEVRFNIFLTIVSAAVAVLFTFAALSSPYASETIENSAPMRTLAKWNHEIYSGVANIFTGHPSHDLEAGYAPLQTTSAEDIPSVPPGVRVALDQDDIDISSDEDEEERQESAPVEQRRDEDSGRLIYATASGDSSTLPTHRRDSFTQPENGRKSSKSPVARRSARHRLLHRVLSSSTTRRTSQDSTPSSTSTTTTSSSESSFTRNLSGTTLATSSSSSWSEPLHPGLSRETRLRIKARAKERPPPEFGWRYWIKTHYESVTIFLCLRAAIWAGAIVFMHYCGMWAMEIPSGRISWDMGIVALSYAVAYSSHFGRQMVFSTIASIGCCSMHYTGMAAATFYTYAPASPNAGYPQFLPITIVGIAVLVCVVSNAILAHAAITARNRMAEIILTKRRLWRIMAEKEAAEQAIELKQQFISVASHEIRTPLHTVNGYCELLVRTPLTDEQSLYVTSIQQACHAINIIAGNLDRNNAELSARPVHMEVRKMIEDIAKITEARGLQPGQQGVDIIVWIAKDVPQAVYLDETYAFRILMNLLSNAQKFCEEGYICLAVSMEGSTQLVIRVMDTGCGIPKSFRGALFEPFRQADTSLTRPRQGTGLGLSIVKHLVQRMSGTVEVESEEGDGSTFTVKLPVTLPSRSPSPTVQYGPPSASKRLRIVYRNARTQDRFIRLWTRYGYNVLPGSATSSASDLAKDVDVIWTDAETASQSPSLRSLLICPQAHTATLFIVHSDAQDAALLEPELRDARNAVLVKRPVIMHTVVEWIENPAEHLGRHVRNKVRFALPGESLPGSPSSSPVEKKMAVRVDVEPVRSSDDIPLTPIASGKRVADEESAEDASLPRDRILLVEDNMINQRLGCRLLEKLGYEVVTANDGKLAIDAIRKDYFACCLMDCQMPVLDGFQATKRIRELEDSGELPDHLPIIALTANVTQESEGDCKAAGMDHFLPKPLKMAGTSLRNIFVSITYSFFLQT
ncbi:uncharacterized protein TRAVEDRAFT_54910 [Trametes versicolor FP-101664 SS1]|uniref:uncharacterized protein n=1 Tax=Trametes versicolor (strain FP-101664) TaxID=717944 RepID=UPI0004623E9C|nr:uncharacterized protein TRAVEDRAFT_54910 [Trametes versicolor FP-101664 SS1]EIW63719.1 hypothetical protein TRAVEDRAFT_54910 [Trametes versicolor FP-101664 SS1]